MDLKIVLYILYYCLINLYLSIDYQTEKKNIYPRFYLSIIIISKFNVKRRLVSSFFLYDAITVFHQCEIIPYIL